MAFPFRTEEPTTLPTWGTWGLIIACLVVFAFLQPPAMQWSNVGSSLDTGSAAAYEITDFQYRWAVVPCEITRDTGSAECGESPTTFVDLQEVPGRWGPLLTAMFLHANLLHLLGNLLFLWVFTRGLEERVGPAGVVGTFLAGGIVAFLAYVLINPDEVSPVLGASGAVAALMGAYLVLHPRRRMLSVVYAAGLQVVYLPAWAVLSFFFASQFFTAPEARVAWQAHVAGMLFGVLVGLGWKWGDPSLRRRSFTVTGSAPGPDGPDGPDPAPWPNSAAGSPPTIDQYPPGLSLFPDVEPEVLHPPPTGPPAPGHR